MDLNLLTILATWLTLFFAWLTGAEIMDPKRRSLKPVIGGLVLTAFCGVTAYLLDSRLKPVSFATPRAAPSCTAASSPPSP